MKGILSLFFLLLMLDFGVIACSCASQTIEEGFIKSSIILHGKVINKTYVTERSFRDSLQLEQSINRLREKFFLNNSDSIAEIKINSYLNTLNSKSIIEVKIKVIEFFKRQNQLSDTITIFTSRSGASCGYTRFEIGKEFIVYATKSKNPLNENRIDTFWTSICTRTKYAEKEELKNLRKLAPLILNRSSFLAAINSIISENLVDLQKDTINVRLSPANLESDIIGEFKIQNKVVISSPKISSKKPFDIYISNLLIDRKHNLGISFKSKDRNGKSYQGTVILKYKREKFKFGDIKYVPATE